MHSQNVLKTETKALFQGAVPGAVVGEIWNYAIPAEPAAGTVQDLAAAITALNSAHRIIEKQEQQIRALENMALTDDLTGLFNRRGFGLALERELAIARRHPQAGGVLVMIDLDGFKSINDLWGHTTGDEYLQAVAAALTNNVRASDLVARLGGDEFAILFTNMDEETGLKRLAKLEKSFNGRMVTTGKRTLPLRASFGLSTYSGSDTAESLFTAADLKLYAHKARRRTMAVS